MKIILIKKWYYFAPYSSKRSFYKKGTILMGERVDSDGTGPNKDVKEGDFHLPHFYSYGQGEVIPQKYFKELRY